MNNKIDTKLTAGEIEAENENEYIEQMADRFGGGRFVVDTFTEGDEETAERDAFEVYEWDDGRLEFQEGFHYDDF